MIDFTTARRHMVDGQVRTADVTDLRILAAMSEIPRERFVPAACAGLAYADLDVPVGGGRRLLKPMVLAKLVQTLELGEAWRVLDVGCATGYGAAVLARVTGEVIALEEEPTLLQAAQTALLSIPNATTVRGSLTAGWPQAAPYDAILLEGAVEQVPQALFAQLKHGGRLGCIFGSGPAAKAMLYRRSGDDIGERAIFDATAAALPGFTQPPEFVF